MMESRVGSHFRRLGAIGKLQLSKLSALLIHISPSFPASLKRLMNDLRDVVCRPEFPLGSRDSGPEAQREAMF
jgi:hypothetical protein